MSKTSSPFSLCLTNLSANNLSANPLRPSVGKSRNQDLLLPSNPFRLLGRFLSRSSKSTSLSKELRTGPVTADAHRRPRTAGLRWSLRDDQCSLLAGYCPTPTPCPHNDSCRPLTSLSRMAAIGEHLVLASATPRSTNQRALSSYSRRYFKLAAQGRTRLRQSRCMREKPRRKGVHSVDGECRTRLTQRGRSQ
jgi:hypothetical protein